MPTQRSRTLSSRATERISRPARPILKDAAEAAIRETGDRLTQPRVAVLTCLMRLDRAASHADVLEAVAASSGSAEPMDRVTVYRVLDWLVETGIAHRLSGDDRIWRFMVNSPGSGNTHHGHAHFTCTSCGQTFCLDSVETTLNYKLPQGFKPTEVDLKFRGRCQRCK